MGDKTTTVNGWCTRYALAQGIYPVQARLIKDGRWACVMVGGWQSLRVGTEFCADRTEAEEAARKMAERKLAWLQKQAAKMKTLTKTPKWRKGG